MSGHRESLLAALAPLRVHSAISYSWFGRRDALLPRTVKRAIDAETARAYLRYSLQTQFYQDFYCPGVPAPQSRHRPAVRCADSLTPFLAALSAANIGQGPQEAGWRIRAAGPRQVVVERQGLCLWVDKGEVRLPSDGRQTEFTPAGTEVTLRLPKELFRLSPGFYLALGDQGLPPPGAEPMTRLYWNLSAKAAPRFVRSATMLLNRASIPFRLKVIDDPCGYNRCDAGVLYLPKRCYPWVVDLLSRLHRELRDELHPGTPAFTKRLSHGLGLAEDPSDGCSFGMHRCALLAEGVVRAHERGQRSANDRVGTVIDCFLEAGVDPDRPYLSSAATDDYPVLTATTIAEAGVR